MKRYAILAYESEYGGLHGMYEIAVVEAENGIAADGIADEMGWDVIETYGLREEDEEDEQVMEHCTEWEIYEIRPDCEKSTRELEEELAEAIGTFCAVYIENWYIEKYCIKE